MSDTGDDGHDGRDESDSRERDGPDPDREAGTPPEPAPTVRSSLLWGLVGGLSFLVSVQGYELLAGQGVAVGVKFGVAALVAVLAAGSTYALEGRLRPENESA